MQRDFGHKNNNRTPLKGYNTPSQDYRHELQYVSPSQQSEQWANAVRRDYEEAYSPYELREVPKIIERTPLGNNKLPIDAYKGLIQETVLNNRLTIIVGETGSGKSTQVPQYLYELDFEVDQTQPRRIAASEVAERIGDEIVERRPNTPHEVSAYQTAEKSTITDDTHISNVTAGLLYAQGYQNRRANITKRYVDPGMVKTCLITDEVHEWGMDTEMELALIRQRVVTHPEMRFVIQSATMDTTALQKYFGEVMGEEPPVIEVPGRTFGVEKKEFPNETSVDRAVARATEMHELDLKQKQMVTEGYDGALLPTDFLVVCPGKREIKDWTDEIFKRLPKEIADTVVFPPLHSKMAYDDQKKAFRTDYPGLRIVMATDTAKTSLTVPGLAGVIDCSYARHEEIDEDGVRCLTLYATSYADRIQWAGRVGRTAPGWCDYAQYDKDMQYIPLDQADAYETPEAQRTNPDRYVLRTAAMGIDFAELKFMHPIDQSVITRAKNSLRVLGALDENGEITTMGRRMNEFPIGTSAARMMIEADQYSPQMRSYMSAIVASMEVGGLPMYTHDAGKRWKGMTDEQSSDLLAQLDIFIGIQDKKMYELAELDLDVKNVQRARETYWKVVRKSSAQIGELIPPNQEERELLKQCIYAGMPDNIYHYAGENTYKGISKDTVKPRSLSNRSVVHGKHSFVAGTPRLIQRYVKGEQIPKDIIEALTVVDNIAVLGKVALSQCEWKQTGDIKWRDGKPVVVKRQLYQGIDLGIQVEEEATPSPETRAAVISAAMENPGKSQQQLREIKKELEALWHLAGSQYTDEDGRTFKMTHDDLVALIKQAAPADVMDPSQIENNIRAMNISIDSYVTAEARKDIIANAPAVIPVGNAELHIAYRSGVPIASRYNVADLAQTGDQLCLDDGREVLFALNRKLYSAGEIKKYFK
ncbi:MAG: hypothetical protein JWM07_913 [Candidatus Saccharibacteria bacterium]|nr:hypothetical protein [Candidatus Saccharibacteria bacterium]